eukprot:131164_1
MRTTLTTRNNYTGPAIKTLQNKQIEELLCDKYGDYSYINWEKKYLQRRFHQSENETKSISEKHENETQTIFKSLMNKWNTKPNINKPLLILDVDNTLIYVRYFSSEMEIGDLVTFFKTNSKINQNNAKVIQLKQTLTLQITNNQFIIGSIIM